MSTIELDVWVTRDFPRTWTHVVGGSFADPQSATQAATDLFCYDRNADIGSFFATVENGRLDDGTLVQDGPFKVGGNHSFGRRWTNIVAGSLGSLLLFYDAGSGVAEFHATDGRGNLTLKKRHTGWRRSWTQIVAGRFGRANLLFYDAANGTGEFYSVGASGDIHLVRTVTGWLTSWHSILVGNFSDSSNDDLLFYDKGQGVGEFYRVDADTGMTLFNEHDNWRRSWRQIVSGQFSPNSRYEGLLFHEEASGFTEMYATDGHGNLSQVDVKFDNQWALPWQVILAGEFTPNIGIIGTSRLCAYDAKDGAISYRYLEPVTIKTLFDLNGTWAYGGTPGPTIVQSFTFLSVNMSAHGRPPAQGSVVDPITIRVTFPDDATYTGTLELPNVIRWSNGSVWTKV